MSKIISRLAPSPTGLIHLGNAWSFVLCWLICRSMDGKLILRIDDLDPERSRPVYVKNVIRDLRWLGLDWDFGPDLAGEENYFQSRRNEFYNSALAELNNAGRLYPCFCSRKELRQMASAPHGREKFAACPCRGLSDSEAEKKIASKRSFSLKIKMDGAEGSFEDLIYGRQEIQAPGDFAVKRSDGVFSYQLASTVDDALTGVNLVVRGNDLLDSCPAQMALLKSLGYKPPLYAHLPLILDHEGDRLAKRHSSLSISRLRDSGVSSRQIIGRLAFWAGLQDTPKEAELAEVLRVFSIDKIPRENIRLPEAPLFP